MNDLDTTISQFSSQDAEPVVAPAPQLSAGELVHVTDVSAGTPSTEVSWQAAEQLFYPDQRRRGLVLARITNRYGRRLAAQDVRVSAVVCRVNRAERSAAGFKPVRSLKGVKAALPFFSRIYSAPGHHARGLRAIVVLFLRRPHTLDEARRLCARLAATVNEDAFHLADPLEPVHTSGVFDPERCSRWFELCDGKPLSIDLFEAGRGTP